MTPGQLKTLKALIDAATPFTSGDVVGETSATLPLMERLEKAIKEAEQLLRVKQQ